MKSYDRKSAISLAGCQVVLRAHLSRYLPTQKSAPGSQSSHLMRKRSFGRINRSFNVFMIKVVCCLMNRKMFMSKNLILDIDRPVVRLPHTKRRLCVLRRKPTGSSGDAEWN